MTGLAMHFDGETYDADRDGARLVLLQNRVRAAVEDHQWHTLAELSALTGGSEASVSARLRDLRKARHGRRVVERRYVGNGLWAYRLVDDSELAAGPA